MVACPFNFQHTRSFYDTHLICPPRFVPCSCCLGLCLVASFQIPSLPPPSGSVCCGCVFDCRRPSSPTMNVLRLLLGMRTAICTIVRLHTVHTQYPQLPCSCRSIGILALRRCECRPFSRDLSSSTVHSPDACLLHLVALRGSVSGFFLPWSRLCFWRSHMPDCRGAASSPYNQGISALADLQATSPTWSA